MTREQVLRIAINIYRSKLGQLPESACIEEYNEEDQTATVHLEYISDLIEPAFVEIDLKLNFLPVMKLHLIKLLPHPAS